MTFNLLQIAYDKGVLERFNNSDEEVKATIESLLVHVQTAYCHSSLGSQLTIERVGDFRYIDQKLKACDIDNLGSDTESHIGNANLMVYMVSKPGGCNYCSGCVGIATLASVCHENRKMARNTNYLGLQEGLCGDAWVSNKYLLHNILRLKNES